MSYCHRFNSCYRYGDIAQLVEHPRERFPHWHYSPIDKLEMSAAIYSEFRLGVRCLEALSPLQMDLRAGV